MEAAQWAHSLPGLSALCLSFPVALIPFRFLSLFRSRSSPHPSSLFPRIVPLFFYLPLTHLICVCSLCPGCSIHLSFSLQNPRWVSPSLPEGTLTLSASLSLRRTRRSSSRFPFALCSPTLPLPLLPPFFFSKRQDCIFNLGRLSFPYLGNGTSSLLLSFLDSSWRSSRLRFPFFPEIDVYLMICKTSFSTDFFFHSPACPSRSRQDSIVSSCSELLFSSPSLSLHVFSVYSLLTSDFLFPSP